MKINEIKYRMHETTLNSWKLKRNHKDISNICKLYGFKRIDVSNALNFGHSCKAMEEKISEYYGRDSEF